MNLRTLTLLTGVIFLCVQDSASTRTRALSNRLGHDSILPCPKDMPPLSVYDPVSGGLSQPMSPTRLDGMLSMTRSIVTS